MGVISRTNGYMCDRPACQSCLEGPKDIVVAYRGVEARGGASGWGMWGVLSWNLEAIVLMSGQIVTRH